jgi:hypothetical protein
MVLSERIVLMIGWTLLIGSEGYDICDKNSLCSIRFYERQYFKGNYWSLDSRGTWTTSRKSRLKVPYRHFIRNQPGHSVRIYVVGKFVLCPVDDTQILERERNAKL